MIGIRPTALGSHRAADQSQVQTVPTKIATVLEFVIAKTRALHSQLYEGDRLNRLLSRRGLPELAADLAPTETLASHSALERRLVERYAESLALLWQFLEAPRDRLMAALATRLQVENVKVILRSHLSRGRAPAAPLPVIALPEPFRWEGFNPQELDTVRAVLDAIPEPTLRRAAAEALVLYTGDPVPLYLEAGLDRGYFSLLAEASAELGGRDRRDIEPMLEFERNLHNLMLILRARANHGLDPGVVTRLTAPAANGRPDPWIAEAAQRRSPDDIVARAPRSLRRLLAGGPADLPGIERRLWQGYYSLANRVYYQTFFSMACPYAFAAVKRMELANLITVVEAVRYGLPTEQTASRLLRPAA